MEDSVLKFLAISVNVVNHQINMKIDHRYVLSSSERRLADERSKMNIMTSKDFDPGSVFFRSTGLKSHDWKEVCTCVHARVLSA